MRKISGMIEDRPETFLPDGTASAGVSTHAAAADHVHPARTASDGAIELVAVPTGESPTGVKGQIAFDDDYFYVCVATDTWKKVALSALDA